MQFCDSGSELVIIPFNQGSLRDLHAFVDHIYDPANGLGWDIYYIFPVAAISETGRDIDGMDFKSELRHRIMLANLSRLIGAMKNQKQQREILSRPAQFILPLSPNHDAFSSDTLYAKSKFALEALFDKCHSERWAPFLPIYGAFYGWPPGTDIMAGNDFLTTDMEEYKIRIFAQGRDAFYILVLMVKSIAVESDNKPIYADMTGGLDSVFDLPAVLNKTRARINETKTVHLALIHGESIEIAEAGPV